MAMIQAQFLCFLIAASYVCSLYLIPASIRALSRDNVTHVQYRLIASGISTLLSVVMTYFLGYRFPGESFLSSIGFRIDTLVSSVILTTCFMIIFYLGPFVVNLIEIWTLRSYEVTWRGELRRREKQLSLLTILRDKMNSHLASTPLLLHYRNLIHAPITEEIAFRSLMILILASTACFSSNDSSSSSSSCILNIALITPAWFAVAHVHHLLEKLFVTKMSLTSSLLSTTIQMIYTSIFGLIASYLFVVTGNIASPIVSHMMCNYFGLPDIGFINPPKSQNSSSLSFLYPHRHLLLFLHALGLILFTLLLISPALRGTLLDIHLQARP